MHGTTMKKKNTIKSHHKHAEIRSDLCRINFKGMMWRI